MLAANMGARSSLVTACHEILRTTPTTRATWPGTKRLIVAGCRADLPGCSARFAGTPGDTSGVISTRCAFRVQVPCPSPAGADRSSWLNHPSWWDPLIGLVLTGLMPASSHALLPDRSQGPRAVSIPGTAGVLRSRGRNNARQPWPSCGRARPSWLVPNRFSGSRPQGEFVDPRERPTRLKAGVGHLVHRLSDATIVPLALEYPFWNDRCPEALARFGEPIPVGSGQQFSPAAWTARMEQALQDTQDRLGEEARRRDPAAFITILGGCRGVGGVYDLWRRSLALARGQEFQAEHKTDRSRQP